MNISDAVLKLKLVQFYIEGTETPGGGLATMKEVQDWGHNCFGIDRNKVKQINQQLVNDGLLKERKKPVQYFQINIVAGSNLLGKVNMIIEHAKISELNKKKRLLTREEVLRKEYRLREGCDQAEEELKQLNEQKEELLRLQETEMRSLQSVVEDLDYKVNVAANECSIWSDNTMQIVQHVINERNDSDIKIEEMVQ